MSTTLPLHDPHSYLGAHPAPDGVVVRALRPEAEAVTLVPQGVELEHVGGGVWECVVEGAELPLAYRFDVRYPNGDRFELEDPYRFLPTIGDLDLHLIGEGRHETLYERLGAHRQTIDGVDGIAFALWAPAASPCGTRTGPT